MPAFVIIVDFFDYVSLTDSLMSADVSPEQLKNKCMYPIRISPFNTKANDLRSPHPKITKFKRHPMNTEGLPGSLPRNSQIHGNVYIQGKNTLVRL